MSSEGVAVEIIRVGDEPLSEEQWEVLDSADTHIYGTPTYMGGASSGFHSFAEATQFRWARGLWADKLAAGFTASASKSGDKSNALIYLAAFAAQHRMLWVSLGVAPGWNATYASEDDINRLGYWLGAGAQSPLDGGTELMHPSDIATAEHLGARVARQTALLVAGRATILAAQPVES